MFMKKPNYRIFDYTPRFYQPEKDEKEKKKKDLGFARQRKHIGKKRSPFIWIVSVLLVIYLILQLKGM